MQTIKVKELMVPLAKYATVSDDATLYEAVLALEEAQKNIEEGRHRHWAVLVCDRGGRVIGKISQLDVLKGLEPRYAEIDRLTEASKLVYSPEVLKSMLEEYYLWKKPLEDICKKAAEVRVSTMMSTPVPGEYVEEETTLDEAIHRMVMGRFQSLLVKRNDDIVGILRLSDVCARICEMIKVCSL